MVANSLGLDKGAEVRGCGSCEAKVSAAWARCNSNLSRWNQGIMRSWVLSYKSGLTFSETLQMNKRKLQGWIKQYSFCTDNRIISHWNQSLRETFLDFENNYFKLLRSQNSKDRALHDHDKKDEAEFKPNNFWEAAYDRPLEKAELAEIDSNAKAFIKLMLEEQLLEKRRKLQVEIYKIDCELY